jgi:hypothetical protein
MTDEEQIARLVEIEKEIEKLLDEGVRIAEEQKVTFDLGGTTFASEYGMGGYRYVPEGSEENLERMKDEWYANDEYRNQGWLTSSSDCD